ETGFPSLLLFLGHTLGNPVDRQQALTNIAASLVPEDILLVGVELYQPHKVSSILDHYRNESFYQAIFESLSFAGFQRRDGTLEVRFNDTTKDVETYFRLNKDITVQVGPSESIQFKAGNKILIFLSHKFNEIELREMCSLAGLNIFEAALNEDQTYLLAFTYRDTWK
ncbi:MAG TPA: L-histidine N(alpha)-methyltransferase, partial [Methylomirabilota bacterium]|nr:L-histidine N(alpha)-methyltransferase [Methylomirabilota bacterium]